ncbi:battenin-like [Stylophora pistillata]|uniref:Battenin n=1 Tax=Stylophora pistillata TaxID=50429 RepID=A0A2B4RSJ7_STYPI|nr:battenin-like [Stylophora pistillata]PFX21404.1 Protein BTN1 [Stylophora pistillata]
MAEKLPDEVANSRESFRNIACFFVFGIFSLSYDETSLAAAEDVLSGSNIPTTIVIIAIAVPVLGVKITAPWFLQRCSYLVKACLVVLLLLAGLIVVVMAYNVHLRLFGISVIESGVSFSEITFLAMTACYHEITVSAFVAGIGVASLLGPFYYTGLTTWLCLAPRTTLLTTFPWPFLVLVTYFILEKKDIDSNTKRNGGVKYEKLTSSENTSANEQEATFEHGLTWEEKFSVAKQILPYITFLFLTYFAEYLSNHSIITTLAFSNSSFSPRDHYQYYIVCYQVGKFLGRSHIFLLSCTCSKVVPYVRVKKTWIFALVEIAHLLFFVFASWFRFVPHVFIVLILCATEGFVAGSMYVNSAHTVSELVSDPRQREFALGLLTIGNGIGKLTAGVVGLHLEPQLKSHCVYDLELQDQCITRYPTEAGWDTNMRCSHPQTNSTRL